MWDKKDITIQEAGRIPAFNYHFGIIQTHSRIQKSNQGEYQVQPCLQLIIISVWRIYWYCLSKIQTWIQHLFVTPQGERLTYPLCLWSALIDLLTVKKFNRGENRRCSEKFCQSLWPDLLVQNNSYITYKHRRNLSPLLLSTSQVSVWVEKLPQKMCVLPNTLAILGAIDRKSSPVCSSLRTAEVCSSVKIESITIFWKHSHITYNES